MSPHEQCPYQGSRVVIDPAFKADAPAQCARLRALGPIHPAEFHLGLKGWMVVGYDLAREALTHTFLLKDATPAAESLTAAGYVLHKPSVGLPEQLRLLRERPELMPGAVEEFLRHDTSVEHYTSGYAAEDIELGGVPIPRGSMIRREASRHSNGRGLRRRSRCRLIAFPSKK
jgi:cytochrome P450